MMDTDSWWWQYSETAQIAQRQPVFLDRDGVINVDIGYLHKPADVILTPGAGEAIRQFNAANLPVIIVTNQSGIGRGYYSWEDVAATQQEIQRQLSRFGAHMDAAFASPCHNDALPPYDDGDHPWRKPHPGMIFAAQAQFALPITESYIVGDRVSDMEAGAAAGLKGGVFLHPDNQVPNPSMGFNAGSSFDFQRRKTLLEASNYILS